MAAKPTARAPKISGRSPGIPPSSQRSVVIARVGHFSVLVVFDAATYAVRRCLATRIARDNHRRRRYGEAAEIDGAGEAKASYGNRRAFGECGSQLERAYTPATAGSRHLPHYSSGQAGPGRGDVLSRLPGTYGRRGKNEGRARLRSGT